MVTYLDEILAHHHARAAADPRAETALADAVATLPVTRGFATALRQRDGIGVIAEVKRRSPSKGALAPDLDPATLAAAYAAGGATCLSVLTDGPYFGGSPEDLAAARRAVSLPVLRKDFTVDRRDLYDARMMGADAVLLIVAALSDDEIAEFLLLAGSLDLDTLVEVHDDAELARALSAAVRR